MGQFEQSVLTQGRETALRGINEGNIKIEDVADVRVALKEMGVGTGEQNQVLVDNVVGFVESREQSYHPTDELETLRDQLTKSQQGYLNLQRAYNERFVGVNTQSNQQIEEVTEKEETLDDILYGIK